MSLGWPIKGASGARRNKGAREPFWRRQLGPEVGEKFIYYHCRFGRLVICAGASVRARSYLGTRAKVMQTGWLAGWLAGD